MTNQVPDYSNLKANLSSMNRFFNDQGVKLTASEQAQIKSIFEEANVEKEKDKNVEEQLVGKERTTFMDKIKDVAPSLYNKIVDFFTVVQVKEDLEQMKNNASSALEKNRAAEESLLEKNEKEIQKEQESLEKELNNLRETGYGTSIDGLKR